MTAMCPAISCPPSFPKMWGPHGVRQPRCAAERQSGILHLSTNVLLQSPQFRSALALRHHQFRSALALWHHQFRSVLTLWHHGYSPEHHPHRGLGTALLDAAGGSQGRRGFQKPGSCCLETRKPRPGNYLWLSSEMGSVHCE